MRAAPSLAALLLFHAGASHAALGAAPEQFNAEGTSVVSSATTAARNYSMRDTILASGVRVREYISERGVVFALTWEGPVMPDLKALLGAHFDAMVAESARLPRAGRSQLAIDTAAVVINSSGHMRAFEGSAWIPAELPAGFNPGDLR